MRPLLKLQDVGLARMLEYVMHPRMVALPRQLPKMD